jgi:hypothetical protein
MLSCCPSSSLRDDHVMGSNSAAFCLRPHTGLVTGPRSVRKAVLAGSKEHEKRWLTGWLAERKPENQKRSTSAATNLHRRAHWAGAAGPDLAIKTHSRRLAIICKGRNSSNRGRACVHHAGGLWMCYSALHLVASFSGNNSLLVFWGRHHETLYMSSCTATQGPYFIAQLLCLYATKTNEMRTFKINTFIQFFNFWRLLHVSNLVGSSSGRQQ